MYLHESLPLHTKSVDAIPWSTWAERETRRNPRNIAKLLLFMAIDSVHQNWSTPCRIALISKGNGIQALATETLQVGELMVPLFVKKHNSVVTEDEGVTIHPKAVGVVVTWSESATALETSRDVEVRLKVQPELKLPTNGPKGFRVDAVQCCSSFLVHSAGGQG